MNPSVLCRDANGALPTVPCDNKWLNTGKCVLTRHHCMKEAVVDGKFIIDGKHVCGAAFCTFCNEHNLCEGSQFCPTHNKDSTLYEESNFSTFSPAITTPSRTLYTTPASSNSNVSNCATPTNMSGGAPAKSLSTKSNQPLSLQKLMRVAAQDENMFVGGCTIAYIAIT